jgi:cold-inducible RNA-binding protein
MSSNLHVGNLTYDPTSSDLQTLFAQHGQVKKALIIDDRDTGRPVFGFVEMETSKEANAAVDSLNGHNVDGRDLIVSVAEQRSS